ncbi:MAG: hypothetical protein WDN48_12725 [Pseudolabrys sp.]
MRGRIIVLSASLFVLAFPPAPAHAQLDGLIGAVTAPMRHLLGRLGHLPRGSRSRSRERSPQDTAGKADQVHIAEIGPSAWPTAFEDTLGYTLWPGTYAEEVRGRGFDIIADTIMVPQRSAPTARATTTGTASDGDGDGDAAKACAAQAEAQVDWPIRRSNTQSSSMTRSATSSARSKPRWRIRSRPPRPVAAAPPACRRSIGSTRPCSRSGRCVTPASTCAARSRISTIH